MYSIIHSFTNKKIIKLINKIKKKKMNKIYLVLLYDNTVLHVPYVPNTKEAVTFYK
jgi:hypothetical protein